MKPIVRWTMGDKCSPLGFTILREAVVNFTNIYKENFDYYIQYNFNSFDSAYKEEELKNITKNLNISLKKQSWLDSPLSINKPEDKNFSSVNSSKDAGSIWKLCPPRLNLNVHEIIMDNDLVIYKKVPQIDEFLSTNDKLLVLQDPVKYYGAYVDYNKDEEKILNAGFIGLHPGYDFASKLKCFWEETGSLKNLSYADEQGLVCATARRSPNILIPKTTIIEMHFKGLCRHYKPNVKTDDFFFPYSKQLFNEFYNLGCGIHFVQSNLKNSHLAWDFYKGKKINNLFI